MADERTPIPQSLIEVWQSQEIETFNPEVLPEGIIRILGQRIEGNWQANHSVYSLIPDDRFDQPIGQGSSPLTDLRHEVNNLFFRIGILSTGQVEVPSRGDVNNLTKHDLLGLYGKAARKLINLFTQGEEGNIGNQTFTFFGREITGLELLLIADEHIAQHTGTLLKYIDQYGLKRPEAVSMVWGS